MINAAILTLFMTYVIAVNAPPMSPMVMLMALGFFLLGFTCLVVGVLWVYSSFR